VTWQWLLALVGASGGAVGLVALVTLGPTVRKARAEARRAEVDIAITEDAAEDSHWQAIVEAQQAQVKALMEPLERRVTQQDQQIERLQDRIEALEKALEGVRVRYARAIDHIRDWRFWRAQHAPHIPAPTPPAEISADI